MPEHTLVTRFDWWRIAETGHLEMPSLVGPYYAQVACEQGHATRAEAHTALLAFVAAGGFMWTDYVLMETVTIAQVETHGR